MLKTNTFQDIETQPYYKAECFFYLTFTIYFVFPLKNSVILCENEDLVLFDP